MALSTVLRELQSVEDVSAQIGKSVTIFGSARIDQDQPTYRLALQVAHGLASSGYSVISGGGPGIMRAAAQGARAAGGCAVGFNISLPFERLDVSLQDVSLTFDNFFTRKLAFARCSHGFVAMPGGMGTLDELFDILTLIQTKKLTPRPIALVDSDFWGGLLDWMRQQLVARGLVSVEEVDAIGVFDSPEQVLSFLESEGVNER
ncbi:LOG family protein [Brucella intermedia]|uniref:LOG family protein n=1 Tax=Brucella intermedia TaxID=94625 RepID=UPI00224B328E|nr:TIGR00730 family Rossman fold protein [Brucella intermedia]